MVLVDGSGTPLGAYLDSARPSEMKLLEKTLKQVPIRKPDRIVADRGYDSNAVRRMLAKKKIEPIIPARSTNTVALYQDGRRLRRYKHRWIVERTFAWLGWFRRLVVRWDRLMSTYAGFFHLACAMLTLRGVLK